MWWVAGNWSMVAMYVAWTANCIYGWYNWTKLNKKSESPKRGLRAEISGIIDEAME